MNIASYIDHTVLKADAKISDIEKLCEEARQYKFAAVCINPVYVSLSYKILNGTGVNIATVVGFPLGANTSYIKAKETEKAISDGANEIDMVINVGLLKSGDFTGVEADIRDVISVATKIPVKVIIETCYLTPDEIVQVSKLSIACGAAYVKTSTGFGSRGASVEDIKLIKSAIGNTGKIKASGGIRDYKFAKELIDLGVHRIGTSSGVKILEEANK